MCPPKPEFPQPPSLPCPSGFSQSTSFGCSASCMTMVIYFTYGNMHVSILLSQIIPPSPSPTESKSLLFYLWQYTCFNSIIWSHPTFTFSHWVQKSVLYIYVFFVDMHVGSLVPSFQIPYLCINIQHLTFSFWLASVCIIGSMFIHLIQTDSNVFIFIAEQYSIVIVPQFTYPFICQWTSRLFLHPSYCK